MCVLVRFVVWMTACLFISMFVCEFGFGCVCSRVRLSLCVCPFSVVCISLFVGVFVCVWYLCLIVALFVCVCVLYDRVCVPHSVRWLGNSLGFACMVT